MYGFNPTSFSDPFDVNKVAETNNRERAKLLSQSFLTDSDLGGKAIEIFGKNKAEDIAAKAQASVNRTASNAAGVTGLIDFAGGMGRIGASPGGFSAFFDKPPALTYEGLQGGWAANPVTAPPPVPGLP